MITLTDKQRAAIWAKANSHHLVPSADVSMVIELVLTELNTIQTYTSTGTDNECEPIPVGMDYISEDGYLYTWDGRFWRNDGPVRNEIRIALRMIRALTDRIVTVEGQLR